MYCNRKEEVRGWSHRESLHNPETRDMTTSSWYLTLIENTETNEKDFDTAIIDKQVAIVNEQPHIEIIQCVAPVIGSEGFLRQSSPLYGIWGT